MGYPRPSTRDIASQTLLHKRGLFIGSPLIAAGEFAYSSITVYADPRFGC